MALAVSCCVKRRRLQRVLALALALAAAAGGLNAEAGGGAGRGVRRRADHTTLAPHVHATPGATTRPVGALPHDAYRMSGVQRTFARARGRITDLQAAQLVADRRISHREAYLLVRSGVEARRARWAVEQEPGDIGVAFSARTEKFIRYGLTRREARLLARSGAQVIRVRELVQTLTFSFFSGTDAAFTDGVPEEPDALDAVEAYRLEKALRFYGLDAGLGRAAITERVKRAYRKIAREAHPDVIESRGDLTAVERARITTRFAAAAEHRELIDDVLGGAK